MSFCRPSIISPTWIINIFWTSQTVAAVWLLRSGEHHPGGRWLQSVNPGLEFLPVSGRQQADALLKEPAEGVAVFVAHGVGDVAHAHSGRFEQVFCPFQAQRL